jgi:hypothetical protein
MPNLPHDDLPTYVADLLSRVQRLEDEQAIVARLHRISFAADRDDEAAFLDCYTADGIFSYASARGEPKVFEAKGRKALADWFAGHRATTPLGSMTHIILHPVITWDGGVARVMSTYTSIRAVGGELMQTTVGEDYDELVRSADGQWRLRARHAVGTMRRTAPAPGA